VSDDVPTRYHLNEYRKGEGCLAGMVVVVLGGSKRSYKTWNALFFYHTVATHLATHFYHSRTKLLSPSIHELQAAQWLHQSTPPPPAGLRLQNGQLRMPCLCTLPPEIVAITHFTWVATPTGCHHMSRHRPRGSTAHPLQGKTDPHHQHQQQNTTAYSGGAHH